MIPKNVRDGATAENLPGEKAYFTIAANGKAFRTLIDGLYSNKVRAVIRELCSNAADSHIDAKQSRPFKVSIPTTLDPTFRVRDFGTSLSHKGVMKLYTTIFESTKEDTNEQTGQLGLGSKSPFAYTDTFSVIAYMDGMRRVYIAYLERDGVPSITHVSDEPTDEPQGLEVAFPAKRDDIRSFQREMQFVSMGYKNPPDVDGMEIAIPKPRLSGTNWAIYPNGAFGGSVTQNHFIRQGSVIYPLDSSFPHVGYGWITVTEVPIGTAEVTASRESLSMDADTRQAIRFVHQHAYSELTEQIDAVMAKVKTRIDKAKVYAEYNGVLDNLKGSTSVSLMADASAFHMDHRYGSLIVRMPGDSLESAAHFGKSANARGVYNRFISSMEYAHLANFQLVVNDTDVKTVRRVKRIRNTSLRGGHVYVYNEADPIERAKGVAWITECFALRADQIRLVSSLPDCPPAPSAKRGTSVKRMLNPGQCWLPRYAGQIFTDEFGTSDRGLYEWPRALVKAASQVGIELKWEEIFWVTEKQRDSYEKKGQLPNDRRLDVVVRKAVDAKVAKAPLDQAQTLNTLHRMVGEYNKALPVVMERFFPHVKITTSQANDTLALAEIAKVDLPKRPIVAKINAQINELIEQYPLLFQRSDRKHYEHYVAAVQAASINSTKKEVSA